MIACRWPATRRIERQHLRSHLRLLLLLLLLRLLRLLLLSLRPPRLHHCSEVATTRA